MASEAFEKWLNENPAGQWASEHAAEAWAESRRQAVEACAAEVEAAGKCICLQMGTSLSPVGAEFDDSGCHNDDGSDKWVDGQRVWPRVTRHHDSCPKALAARLRRLA